MADNKFPKADYGKVTDTEAAYDKQIADLLSQESPEISELEKQKTTATGKYGQITEGVEAGQMAESIVQNLLKAYAAYRGLKDKQDMSKLEVQGMDWDSILKGRLTAAQKEEAGISERLLSRRKSLKDRITQLSTSKEREMTRAQKMEDARINRAIQALQMQQREKMQQQELGLRERAIDVQEKQLETQKEKYEKSPAAQKRKIEETDRKFEENIRQWGADFGLTKEQLKEAVANRSNEIEDKKSKLKTLLNNFNKDFKLDNKQAAALVQYYANKDYISEQQLEADAQFFQTTLGLDEAAAKEQAAKWRAELQLDNKSLESKINYWQDALGIDRQRASQLQQKINSEYPLATLKDLDVRLSYDENLKAARARVKEIQRERSTVMPKFFGDLESMDAAKRGAAEAYFIRALNIPYEQFQELKGDKGALLAKVTDIKQAQELKHGEIANIYSKAKDARRSLNTKERSYVDLLEKTNAANLAFEVPYGQYTITPYTADEKETLYDWLKANKGGTSELNQIKAEIDEAKGLIGVGWEDEVTPETVPTLFNFPLTREELEQLKGAGSPKIGAKLN